MTTKQHGLKKFVVKLTDEERSQLNALIDKGKHPAQKLLKARILLKADVSADGPGWSDGQIAAALDTSVDTVARTRQQLVEEGVETALTRKLACVCPAAYLRWCGRGQVDRAGLLRTTQGPYAMDAGTAGRGRRRTENRRACQR